jgi:hypothetical protein
MAQQRLVGAAFLTSGALAIAGALLPWLTLYAGFYQYSGMVGMYGRIILAAGIIVFGLGLTSVRVRLTWLPWAGALCGVLLTAFAAWLYEGLIEIMRRPDTAMFAPRAGPGVLVVFAAGVLLTALSAALVRVR